MIKICGIDYSSTCPAISVGTYDGGVLVELKQYFATYKKSEIKDHAVVTPTLMVEKDNDNQTIRYAELGNWALSIVKDCDYVLVEDYAFAAAGRVFHIGENMGLLKYLLTTNNINFGVVGPKVVKKVATGSGNADKDQMYEAYKNATGIDLGIWQGKKKSISSPIGDLSDSYWILVVAATDKINYIS